MDPGRPGRAEDLSRLFEAHYADVVRIAFYLTGSWAVAEELAQEAFLRLWRRWGGLRDHGRAAGYLRATVVNLSRSSLRRRLVELRHQRGLAEVSLEAPSVTLAVGEGGVWVGERGRETFITRFDPAP